MVLPAELTSLHEASSLPPRPLHLAIGIFDGVHLGHRAVVESAIRAARAGEGISGVLTFWPHPSALFRPEDPTRMMQDARTKSRMLISLGVDVVITETFTRELAAVPAAEFLPWLRQFLPRLAAVYVGENFRFGNERRGDVALLAASGRGRGVNVISASPVSHAGQPISSTRIRAQLAAGEIESANALLGYSYFSEGTVVPGKRLGRTIGFPTLNVLWAPEFKPRYGVYAVRVAKAGTETALPAVANYGVRPTVEDTDEPRLEIHVLGECTLTEGDRVRVEWLHFLRPEMKLANLEELRMQIGRDRAAAAEFFGV